MESGIPSGCRPLACALLILVAFSHDSTGATSPVSQNSLRPPSPTERFVTANGASLYLLDWGGKGPILLFLPGFGTGAHIFDQVAPAFTDRFHVLAMTPRGFPPSSAPEAPYTVDQLVADVRAVLDILEADEAVLAGHSISGAVITRFATLYPKRLRAAVYLDAAFDFGPAFRRSQTRPRMGPPGSIDTTAATYRAWQQRFPDWDSVREADSRMWDIDSADVARRQSLVRPLADEVRAKPHEVWRVRAPALAICAGGSTAELMDRLYGWLTPDSTRWQDALAAVKKAQVAKRSECKQFRRRLLHGESLELESGHFVFIDRREAVIKAMRRFLVQTESN